MTSAKSESQFLRPKDFPQLELYRAVNSARAIARHVHFVDSIGVAESGTRLHVTRRGEFWVKPGTITLVRAGETHSGRVPAGELCSGRAMRVAPEYMDTLVTEIGGPAALLVTRQPVIQDAELARGIIALHELLQRNVGTLEKQTALLEVFAILLKRHGRKQVADFKPIAEQRAVSEACGYLQECFRENVTLEQLAALTGLSSYYLCRVFTRVVGVPPHAYQLQVRLRHAADFLAQGMSPLHVALETGFFDQSHFHRAFRKKYGVAPGRYLRQTLR